MKADPAYWDARYKFIAAPLAEGYVEVERLPKDKSQKSITRYFAQCWIFSLDKLSVYMWDDLTAQPFMRQEVKWNVQLIRRNEPMQHAGRPWHDLAQRHPNTLGNRKGRRSQCRDVAVPCIECLGVIAFGKAFNFGQAVPTRISPSAIDN